MTSGRLLRQLIKIGARDGGEEFRRVAEEVIREERLKNHHLLANDLERILYGEHSDPGRKSFPRVLYDIPRDRERGLPLLAIREPVRDLQDIVLSDVNKSILEEVLLENSRAEVLASYGLKPISRLLFCGPPGCGKTLAAEVLAAELGLELAVVRFDAVVSSFLGETSANLRKVFDFLETSCFVALFDEFDAIGKTRDDLGEHGELKRVVNSFLQMMDGFRGKSILIAATNHERLLDKALWRRFDEVLFFERPNLEQIRQLLIVKLRGVRYDLPLEDRSFLNQFKGFSHADIERILIRAIKTMVLKGREFLTLELVEEARKREEERQNIVLRL
ncbi:AAA family ATPase [Desulfofundulus thermocisternus]|jgi:SpoVK/Ycf46/Vps4 family AAA+-type ATPase|uniref:AAA family ATPase n=1 Tax=Desulfofundulus thermocisternus TaxID=42471 RepID=UPI00217D6AE4|nr:ATP-binding protein [Desulfofundulus thermocisternus]MCS5697190.1 ATP-binding protein [Desulfofundulus thermocisternus]